MSFPQSEGRPFLHDVRLSTFKLLFSVVLAIRFIKSPNLRPSVFDPQVYPGPRHIAFVHYPAAKHQSPSTMASRLSPFLRVARTAAPLRQTVARPFRSQLTTASRRGFLTTATLRSDDTPEIQSFAPPRPRNPESYHLSFTCRPCSTRSNHTISKQGYHHGSVLVTCPECKNRHVISDHLNIFGDRKITVEDLVKEQGGIVRKGSLNEDGDIEFWADGQGDGEAVKKTSEA